MIAPQAEKIFRDLVMLLEENKILHYLYAGRPKDLADVVDILVLARTDMEYTRRWADRLGVTALLEGCRKAASEAL